MARNRKSNSNSSAKDIIELVAMLPWWAGVVMAIVSYFALHAYAKPDPAFGVVPGQVGGVVAHTIFKALATVAQYLIPILCIAGAGLSAWKRRQRIKLVDNVTSSNAASALDSISWQEFEILVGESFSLQGYKVAEVGGAGPDGGVDLVLQRGNEKFLVQCKQWKAFKVGVDVVRQLYGVMAAKGAAGGFVVTSGRFTPDATAFASGRNIELIEGAKLFAMIKFAQANRKSKPETTTPMLEVVQSAPTCALCSGVMVKREAKRGTQTGKVFWGCSNYPVCKGTKPV